MAKPTCVLVTRPEPEARQTAERLVALGFDPLVSPVLSINHRMLRLPRGVAWQAILLTSGNAVAALPAPLCTVPVLAVGDATAARARRAGFGDIRSAGRDAAALIRLVSHHCVPSAGPLLLPTGAGQGESVAVALRACGFRVVRRVAYAASAAGTLQPQARAALADGRVVAALFFSPQSARAFVRACRPDELVGGVRAIAISAATAVELAPLRWADIRVASRPNQDELLACLT